MEWNSTWLNNRHRNRNRRQSESEIEITAPNFHAILQWVTRAIVCESEIRNGNRRAVKSAVKSAPVGNRSCGKSVQKRISGPPHELAVVPAPRIKVAWYLQLALTVIKVAWYLQLALTVINALRGWSVSALVAQKLSGAFNWT